MYVQAIKRNWQYIVIGILILALTVSLIWVYVSSSQANLLRNRLGSNNGNSEVSVQERMEEHGIVPLTKSQASNDQSTNDELAFLLEEEKLAHDVYQALYDRWGARVFMNIMNSESAHQDMVWAVMESRGLVDPRKPLPGDFANQELQAFYDSLIAQGVQGISEAYEVGATIETRDISDLKITLASLDAKDSDVKAVVENLLHSSENHLRAFNRQLDR